jgi:hypothetical protein
MIVIAHYKKIDALWRSLSCMLLVILLSAISYSVPYKIGFTSFLSRPLLLPLFVSGWLFGLFLIWILIVLLKRVLFDAGRALWIENGKIIFLHKWNISVACSEVAQIKTGIYGRFHRAGIFLNLRNGTRKVIPTGSLKESEDLIVARLKENLAS